MQSKVVILCIILGLAAFGRATVYTFVVNEVDDLACGGGPCQNKASIQSIISTQLVNGTSGPNVGNSSGSCTTVKSIDKNTYLQYCVQQYNILGGVFFGIPAGSITGSGEYLAASVPRVEEWTLGLGKGGFANCYGTLLISTSVEPFYKDTFKIICP